MNAGRLKKILAAVDDDTSIVLAAKSGEEVYVCELESASVDDGDDGRALVLSGEDSGS